MAALRFKIAVDQTGEFAPPILSDLALKAIGQTMVLGQKARWSRGQNVLDKEAKPLSKVTAKAKRTYRGISSPIRDMQMTGLMRDNFTLRKATMAEIRAENTSRAGRMHARKAQKFEQMIGFSPRDEDALFALVYRAYGLYLEQAWRPRRG